MKKRIAIIAVLLFMSSSISFASPLMDYSVGKASIDLMWNNTKTTTYASGYSSEDSNKKFNLDSSITLGLGNNFALQYRNFEPRGTIYSYPSLNILSGVKTYEVNVLKKLNHSNIAVFVGIVPTKIKQEMDAGYMSSLTYGKNKDYWQVGATAVQNVGPKAKLYERIAMGENWTNLEGGVSYPIVQNVEFNVNYRYIKARDLSYGMDNLDSTAKGIGCGVTYKF